MTKAAAALEDSGGSSPSNNHPTPPRRLTPHRRTRTRQPRGEDEDPMSMTTQLASNEGLLGFASGLVAGIVGVLTGYPLDTLKVKMQVYGNTASLLDANTNTRNPVVVLRQLFRGVLPPLATTGLVQTLNFGIYDNTLRYLRTKRELEEMELLQSTEAGKEEQVGVFNHDALYANSLSDYLVAGAVGGAAISFITCPASLVKIQMQTATSSSVNYWTILAGMRSRGLVSGYYRAFLPDILNQCFGRGVYMCTYEALKRTMRKHQIEEDPTQLPHHLTQPPPLYQRILAGALAGVAGWLVIYPLDVVKSRLQADALAPGRNKYSTMTDCFRQSYKAGGIRSLYSGLGFTLLRAVPVASVILPSYDATYYLLSKYVDEEQ